MIGIQTKYAERRTGLVQMYWFQNTFLKFTLPGATEGTEHKQLDN